MADRFDEQALTLLEAHHGRVTELHDLRASVAAALRAAHAEGEAERDRLRAELEHMRSREAHYAKVLGVSDSGTYRHDWTGAIDRLRAKLEAAHAVVEAARNRDGCNELCSVMRDYRGRCTCGSEDLDGALARYDATRQGEIAVAAKVLGVEAEEVE